MEWARILAYITGTVDQELLCAMSTWLPKIGWCRRVGWN